MKFKTGENNITYIDSNFQEWFGEMKVEKSKEKLIVQKLPRYMTDREILDELKPKECTLGDVYHALQGENMLKNSYANIFYAKDSSGVLRAVLVHWNDDGWVVRASSIEHPYGWYNGHQVFSRNSVLKPSDTSPQTLRDFDPLTLALKTVIDAGYIVYKQVK